MRKRIVWNADGLTKFHQWEEVYSELEYTSGTDVKVYKIWTDWEILRNDNGNKVSYSIAKNRLRSAETSGDAYEKAWILEKRVMQKTFTDKNLDIAADQIKLIKDFVKATYDLKLKLEDIGNKLLGKVESLNQSVELWKSDEFKKLMEQVHDINDYLKDKPMVYVKELHDHLVGVNVEEDYDPAEDLLG